MGFAPFANTGIIVEWDDWDAGNQDLDVFVVDADGNPMYASQNIQDGSGNPPFEGVFYEFPDYGPYFLIIAGNNITRPVTIDVFANYADFDPDRIVPEYSLLSPSDAPASFTICATNWESGQLTDYSSQGPTVDGRLKPDMCGPTETYSVAFGDEFAGTSNSSPQVAGAAILIRQAFPEFTVDQVKSFLLDRAQDAGPSGPDTGYGVGLLWMGDPPGEEVVITAPPLEDTPGGPTETPIVIEDTREPIIEDDEETPSPVDKVSGMDTTWLIIGALGCCFMLFAVLGLVLLIVLLNRRKRQPRKSAPPRYPPARPRPPAGIPPAKPGAGQPRSPAGYPPVRQGPPPPPPGALTCPRCGTPHAPQVHFCPKCGLQFGAPPPPQQPVQQSAQCRHCGQPIRPGAAFCPKCGQKQ